MFETFLTFNNWQVSHVDLIVQDQGVFISQASDGLVEHEVKVELLQAIRQILLGIDDGLAPFRLMK